MHHSDWLRNIWWSLLVSVSEDLIRKIIILYNIFSSLLESTEYALKIISLENYRDDEVGQLRTLKHVNIVRFFDYWREVWYLLRNPYLLGRLYDHPDGVLQWWFASRPHWAGRKSAFVGHVPNFSRDFAWSQLHSHEKFNTPRHQTSQTPCSFQLFRRIFCFLEKRQKLLILDSRHPQWENRWLMAKELIIIEHPRR